MWSRSAWTFLVGRLRLYLVAASPRMPAVPGQRNAERAVTGPLGVDGDHRSQPDFLQPLTSAIEVQVKDRIGDLGRK